MKRKSCLVEEVSSDLVSKVKRFQDEKMFRNASSKWLNILLTAEKSCLKEGTLKKIHYKLPDEQEMVEEYNMDTGVLVRRAWKVRGPLGGEGTWDVEVGDMLPEPKNIDAVGIMESNDQPIVTRRNTRINLEWRIRNLPYSIETYCVSADKESNCIIVRTTNKKYYKKLNVPELQRLNVTVEQANVSSSHKFNTLIILYKKPPELREMEKVLFEELKNVKPKMDSTDVPADCKPS